MNLSELAGWGKVVKEIEPLVGLKMQVHSLTAKEENEIYLALSRVADDSLVKTSVLQTETLARAIESINGEKFHDIQKLLDILNSMQRHVLSVIWQAWVKEIEEPSLLSIENLKKNSEPQKPA